MVRRLFRITVIVGLGLLLVIGGGALAFWKALQQVPEFYQEAMLVTPAFQEESDGQAVPMPAPPAGGHQPHQTGWEALFTQAEALANERLPQNPASATPEQVKGKSLPTPPISSPDPDSGLVSLFGRAETLANDRQAQQPAARPTEEADGKTPRTRPAPGDGGKQQGRWNGLFTAEDLNRWLAANAREHFAETSYGSLNDLRVAIAPKTVAIGCRLQRGRVNTVFSISGEAELVGDNVIAVRIQQAKAGAVPLRIDEVSGPITKAADCCGLDVRWAQAGGDPVAMITLPLPSGGSAGPGRLDALRLGEDEAWLSGPAERH